MTCAPLITISMELHPPIGWQPREAAARTLECAQDAWLLQFASSGRTLDVPVACWLALVQSPTGIRRTNDVTPEWKKLQTELQETAVALLTEARASALALSLEEDRDGYWIAIGPRSQIPFLLGNADNGSPAEELMHASAEVAPLNHYDPG